MLIKWVDFGGATYTVDNVKHVANHGIIHENVARIAAQYYDGIDVGLNFQGGPIIFDADLDGPRPPLPEDATVVEIDGQTTAVTVGGGQTSGLYLAVVFEDGRREHWFMNAQSAYLMSEAGATVDRLHP